MNKKEIAHTLKGYPTALTVDEVAKILRVSTKTTYKLIDEKALPAIKVGRAFRISKADVINFMRRRDKESSNPKCVVNENSPDCVWTSAVPCSIVRLPNGKYLTRGMMISGDKTIPCRKRTG